MSTATASIDAVANLSNWIQGLTGMMTADIHAIPQDKLTWSPGGVARPANALIVEVAGLCRYTAAILRGDEPGEIPSEEQIQAIVNSTTTHAALAKALGDASAELTTALSNATNETLNKTVTPPWKLDCTVYMLAQITASHIWYHDGQLNYIQALLGDEKVHWIG